MKSTPAEEAKHTPTLIVKSKLMYLPNLSVRPIAYDAVFGILAFKNEEPPSTLEEAVNIETQINSMLNEYDKLKAEKQQLRDTLNRLDEDAANTIVKLKADNARMLEALERIANWELPKTHSPNLDGQNYSFESLYGSNGARDYIKGVAKTAIDETKK